MKWLEFMLGAMFANGFALLGAKVLTESGLGKDYGDHYLLGWYVSGLVVALLYSIRGFHKPYSREIAIGAGMAAMSFLGQLCLVRALGGGAPGYLVYPIASAANVLFVAVGGVVLFKEKLGTLGIAGIACGLVSVLILSLP
jgi:multidrug transporter EmrE-like cation transporter